MSGFFDNDIFSPVRLDLSSILSNEGSEEHLSDSTTSDAVCSFPNVTEDEPTLENNAVKLCMKSDFKSKDSECTDANTPVTNRSSNDLLNTKKWFSKAKLENKDFKNVMIKENSKNQQKKDILLNNENSHDSQALTLDTSEKRNPKMGLKPMSIVSSKKDSAKCNLLKDQKKEQKSSKHSKLCSSNQLHKSNSKLCDGKNPDDFPNSFENFSDLKFQDPTVTFTELKRKNSDDLWKKKSTVASSHVQNLTCNPLHTPYESSVEKMIHGYIGSECAKLRQDMYIQQMSFYRKMNKIREEMEQEHFETTEHLFKVIEELMQMNASLKLALLNKN